MVKLTKIYTRGGDSGETSLGGGTRVLKSDPRVEAYGAVDAANDDSDEMLARIQNDLFDVGADLCRPEDTADALRIVAAQVERLEQEIDAMNSVLAPLESFVLPGGASAAAELHVARTAVRRAERFAVALAQQEKLNPAAIHYLNRLSDHLFQLARVNNDGGAQDMLWVPGATR